MQKQDKPKKNDLFTAVIRDYTNEGSGVARYMDMVVFVPGVAVGDEAQIRIVKVLSSYCYGRLEKIITPSPDRIDPLCPVCSQCGGCDFQHISYDAEKKAKEKFVRDAFSRIGGLDVNVLPIKSRNITRGYRNKAQYPFAEDANGRTVFGFYAKHSHRVVPYRDCLLQPDIFNRIARKTAELSTELGIPVYDETTGKGILRHIYIRRGEESGQIMVCLVCTKGDFDGLDALSSSLRADFPEITTLIVNINSRNTNVVLGDENRIIFGPGLITDTLCGIDLEISPRSFYQVNHDGARDLYAIAKDALELSGDEILMDLYCGAGTIGLSMADSVRELIGVEIVPQAVEDAKRNARKLGVTNARFICSDAGRAAAELAESGFSPDAVIVDPPRKGCDRQTLSAILKMAPEKICMISCNPVTAARDCRTLSDNGYKVLSVQPYDMFPRTRHVETVCCLYHQKKDFISVPYEPKDAEYLKKTK